MQRFIFFVVLQVCLLSSVATSAPIVEERKLTAGKIAQYFATNEAFADENYVGRKLEVAGKVARISSNTRSNKPSDRYVLELDQDTLGSTNKVDVQLEFMFTEDDRSILAKLKPGQEIVISGECGRPGHWTGDIPTRRKDYIRVTITNCEVIKGK